MRICFEQTGTAMCSPLRAAKCLLSDVLAETLDRTMNCGDSKRVALFLAANGMAGGIVDEKPPESVRLHALSLAIAQKCNLGCTYRYAQQGGFGGKETNGAGRACGG
jgi:hypothetical protein